MTRDEVLERQNYQDVQTQQGQMQKASRFDINTRVAEIEEVLRHNSGKIEELEHRQKSWENQWENRVTSERQREEEHRGEIKKKIELLMEELKTQRAEIDQLKAELELLQKEKIKKMAPTDIWKEAERLFGEKEWKKAILSYEKYRETHPKGPHYVEATYKIGLCFEKLGMKEEALSFYQEVVTKFPKSVEAQKAKVRIKNVK
ncbi:MAG: tetratricopeptide repeat protein [Bdellovibrionaceae bacterium]|nr:tetratricopeptide repeat protein [Pseudobdellovibrionaceae bacterium]MDW8189819.1 tetratricopeptide repeat protein [Pseudobdellovibrionaceae bacterium]